MDEAAVSVDMTALATAALEPVRLLGRNPRFSGPLTSVMGERTRIRKAQRVVWVCRHKGGSIAPVEKPRSLDARWHRRRFGLRSIGVPSFQLRLQPIPPVWVLSA